jgi:glycosyltransferase involved in cell wall biosynthesis
MSRPVRLALFAASPVYYQAPLYRRLAADARLDFTAIFASDAGVRAGDFGYGEDVAFDVDALGGFRSVFLRGASGREANIDSPLSLCNPDVVRVLRDGDYDVVWMHGYASCTHLLVALTQRLRRRPLLLRDDQTLLTPRPAWKRAAKRVVFRTLLRDAITLPVGTENERWLRAHGLRRASFHVPYASDLSPSADRAVARRAFGIADDAGPVVLSVARLIPKKQPLLVLEAFARVRAGARCKLLLVGSGGLEPEVRARAVELDVADDVVLAGFVNRSRIATAYAAGDVFVLASSHDETWGVAVNEAMQASLPVVLSDRVGCAVDLLRHGVNGFAFRHDDVDGLAARIGRLVASPSLRREQGAWSRRLVDGWTYETAAAGVVDAVAHAVGRERWLAAQARDARRAA